MKLMFTDLFIGTYYEASVWSEQQQLFRGLYTQRNEAKTALKTFILQYDGNDALTCCYIRQVDNIRESSNTNEYPRYLKLQRRQNNDRH